MTHLSQFKLSRLIIIIVLVLAFVIQSISFLKFRNQNITDNRCGLIVYKGVPIPFFDMMIFPDGSFRLVDKKEIFNKRDLETIYARVDDILLIGSGYAGRSIEGFPEKSSVQFVFNHIKKKGLQVIILPTNEACDIFNRLRSEGKNVLFIIHNSC